ncbi:MAG: DNA alkylation repair protein, partial [Candidatus Pacebacteria bacterium]|nr:DNA alkylation repair protein [Candidatus Paceibacterota bacterium]
MNNFSDIQKELRLYANENKVSNYQRFFKTAVGEYGEGDKFLGVTVPNIHIVAKKFSSVTFDDIKKLLESPYHEERMLALFILVEQFEKGDE